MRAPGRIRFIVGQNYNQPVLIERDLHLSSVTIYWSDATDQATSTLTDSDLRRYRHQPPASAFTSQPSGVSHNNPWQTPAIHPWHVDETCVFDARMKTDVPVVDQVPVL